MSLPPPQPPDTYPCNPDSSYSHFVVRQFTPSAITQTLPVQVTIASNGFISGDVVRTTQFIKLPYASATGMEQLNNRSFVVQVIDDDNFYLYDSFGVAIDGRNYTAYVSGGQFTLVGPTLPIINPTYAPPSGVPPFPPV